MPHPLRLLLISVIVFLTLGSGCDDNGPGPCANPPSTPCGPSPSAGATDVSISTDLVWDCGDTQCGRSVTYYVYFGDNSQPPKVATTSSKSHDPGTLAFSTHYYWRIVAVDVNGSTSGSEWDFVTGGEPCTDPPTTPCEPSPADGSTDASLVSTYLAWSCGDTQCGHSVSYDVYFGTDDSPNIGELACEGCGEKTFDPGPLSPDRDYYWKIVAKDASGETPSPVWHFTTEEWACTDPPTPPCRPSPPDGATEVSVDADLSWSCGNAVCETPKFVIHEVYFGDSSPPPKVPGPTGFMRHDPGALAYNTVYFWRVVARDIDGETWGPVWHFKTIESPHGGQESQK